jgi:hypothetical protein
VEVHVYIGWSGEEAERTLLGSFYTAASSSQALG